MRQPPDRPGGLPLVCTVVGAIALGLCATSAGAHDLLLDPSHDHLDARSVVSMRLFLGHAGEEEQVEPNPKASALYVCVTPDGKRHVPGSADVGLGLFDAAQAGVYVFGYATRPSVLSATREDLLAVIADAGREAALRKEIEGIKLARPWRVEEVHHAKSIVVIDAGELGKQDAVLELEFELFLDRRPDQVVAGKPLVVRVLRGGKPLAGARVVAFPRKATTRELVAQTDAKGQAGFTLPTSGAWAVRTVRLTHAPRGHVADWLVERSTLTFEIPNHKRKMPDVAKSEVSPKPRGEGAAHKPPAGG